MHGSILESPLGILPALPSRAAGFSSLIPQAPWVDRSSWGILPHCPAFTGATAATSPVSSFPHGAE